MFRGVNMRGAQIYIKKTESGGGGVVSQLVGSLGGVKISLSLCLLTRYRLQ